MASVNKTDDDPLQGGATSDVSTSTNSGGSGSDAGSTGTTSDTPGSAAPPDQNGANPQQDLANVQTQNSSFDFSPLLNYVGQQGTDATNSINSENSKFTSALGAAPSFGDSQKSQIDSFVNGGTSDRTPAYSAIHTPDNSSSYAPIGNNIYDPLVSLYTSSAGQLNDPNGLQALLGRINPAETQGELAFDASIYGQNPTFRSQARTIGDDAQNVSALASNTTAAGNAAIPQRSRDIAAFNQAGQGYVAQTRGSIYNNLQNYLTNATNADRGVQNDLSGFQSGNRGYDTAAPGELTFNPADYQQTISSQFGPDVFNQSINPNAYLRYSAGDVPTLSNVGDPNMIAQYNRAGQLIDANDSIQPGVARNGAHIGIDQAAFAQALSQLLASRNSADANWIQAHQPPPPPPPAPVEQQAPTYSSYSGGGQEGSSDGGSGDSGSNGGGAGSDSGTAGGGTSGSDGTGGSDTPGYNKGGPVKARNFDKGGPTPGQPNSRIDDIPARVDQGEYVLQAPAAATLGPDILNALNQIQKAPPQAQNATRAALMAALSRQEPQVAA